MMLEPVNVCGAAERSGNVCGIDGCWPRRPIDAVERLPQRAQVALRVSVGQLDHHAPLGMAGEFNEKWGQVAHVVEDVVTHDFVCLGGRWGDIRPATDDLRVPDSVALSPFCKYVEHSLALVDCDQECSRRCQREACGATACTDVEH